MTTTMYWVLASMAAGITAVISVLMTNIEKLPIIIAGTVITVTVFGTVSIIAGLRLTLLFIVL